MFSDFRRGGQEYGSPCECYNCSSARGVGRVRMFLCPRCGNKRCPHATDHEQVCTGSNEPGQPGSAY